MFTRKLPLSTDIQHSVFLFGARQTGKTTFLRKTFPNAVYIDLLDTRVFAGLSKRPYQLYEMLVDEPADKIVIIDEIQQIPILLNEVHRLIVERDMRFILCGSSARKLKRQGTNTLGGRAVPYKLLPLISEEIDDFHMDHALLNGLLPRHYLAKDAQNLLAGYIDIYLREEIKAESLVRNLTNFQRFLEIAAQTSGEMVNYSNIASDCGVSAPTVREYFSILEDTLLGYFVPAYTHTVKRSIVQTPKFYLFDVGVTNFLLRREKLEKGTIEYGRAFEQFIMLELIAYLSYSRSRETLSYWRTHTGIEVDAIIGDAKIAIEFKSTEEVLPKHLKGLIKFAEEYPDSRRIIVSNDIISRHSSGVEIMFVRDFLHKLWKGDIIR